MFQRASEMKPDRRRETGIILLCRGQRGSVDKNLAAFQFQFSEAAVTMVETKAVRLCS